MKNNFRVMLLAMATLGLFSCSDKLADDVAPSEGTTGYVAFKISSIGDETRATRAVPGNGDFDHSDPNEYKISETEGANVAFFYAADGTYHSSSLLTEIEAASGAGNDNEHTNKDLEKVYQAHIKDNAGKEIKYCLLVLNGNPIQLQDLKGDLKDTKKAIEETYLGWGDDNHEYFTMTNTVYVKADGTVQTEIVIDPFTQIRSTPEEAENNPIVVHVERVLAKFTLIFGEDASKPIIDEKGIIMPAKESENITFFKERTADGGFTFESVKWRVAVKGWDINATEQQTYWFKNLDDGKVGTNNWKFGDWEKDYTGTTLGWNDITRLRSYWAVDPHYNEANAASKYPSQFRQADGIVYGDNGNGAIKTDLILKYQNYTHFSTQTDVKASRYAVENTFDYDWMNADDYKRTGTHIIIAAQLETENSDNTWQSQTLYNYNGFYWRATNDGKMSDDLKEYMLKRVLAEWKLENGELYKSNGTTPNLLEGTVTDFEDYFTIASATVKNGDGRVMMQLKEDDTHTLYKKETGSENLTKLTDAELATFKNSYLKVFGTARRFNNGEMYYPVFIRHMVTPGTDNYKVGSYGVVRNHWYKATITAINNPGIPVDDPTQPIIPNDDPDADGYVSFEIVIIPWHLVNWEVDF